MGPQPHTLIKCAGGVCRLELMLVTVVGHPCHDSAVCTAPSAERRRTVHCVLFASGGLLPENTGCGAAAGLGALRAGEGEDDVASAIQIGDPVSINRAILALEVRADSGRCQ